MILCHELTFFVKHETKCKNCCTENEINGRMELLIYNIEFGGYIVQQNIGIRMGTTWALLISSRFLYSYEAKFMQKRIKDKQVTDVAVFIISFRYVDEVLSVNNLTFANWNFINIPNEFKIKETAETASYAWFHYIYLINLTYMVNFLPDFMTKETTPNLAWSILNTFVVIYQPFPLMVLIFHNSYATLGPAVCIIRLFYRQVCFISKGIVGV